MRISARRCSAPMTCPAAGAGATPSRPVDAPIPVSHAPDPGPERLVPLLACRAPRGIGLLHFAQSAWTARSEARDGLSRCHTRSGADRPSGPSRSAAVELRLPPKRGAVLRRRIGAPQLATLALEGGDSRALVGRQPLALPGAALGQSSSAMFPGRSFPSPSRSPRTDCRIRS